MTSTAQQTRVLIVDDERNIADTLVMIVRSRGYDARAVYSGEEVLEILETFRPDVILSDIIMPGINGVILADRVFSLRPKCKVILMSGNAASTPMLEEAVQRGRMYAYLEKPFRPAALLDLLEPFKTLP